MLNLLFIASSLRLIIEDNKVVHTRSSSLLVEVVFIIGAISMLSSLK